MRTICVYREIGSDGYGTDWQASCGYQLRCSAPIDVGWSFDPLPTENGKYCHKCGGEIVLKERK